MNRHMTWGDRQAETAREKNLEKLRKLAASAPSVTEEPQTAAQPEKKSAPTASAKTTPAAAKTAKKPAKAAAKKAKAAPPAKKKTTKK